MRRTPESSKPLPDKPVEDTIAALRSYLSIQLAKLIEDAPEEKPLWESPHEFRVHTTPYWHIAWYWANLRASMTATRTRVEWNLDTQSWDVLDAAPPQKGT